MKPTYAIEGNGMRPSHLGSGMSRPDGPMFTLNTLEVHAVAYPDKEKEMKEQNTEFMKSYMISSMGSNAMKSDNPNSGINETSVSCTLDCTGTNPTKNQGGVVVVEGQKEFPIDRRNECREKRIGNYFGNDGDPVGTITTKESLVPAVCTDETTQKAYERHGMAARCRELESTAPALQTVMDGMPLVREPMVYDSHPMDSRVTPVDDVTQTISTRFGGESDPNTVLIREPEETHYVVRRITPTECERLQGFPDGYTDVPWPGKDHAPDSHRYKALGNSMAVPVMRWIGRRIEESLADPIVEDKSEEMAWQPDLFDF